MGHINELKEFLEFVIADNQLNKDLKNIWNEQGRSSAIRYYMSYKSHICKPSIHEACEYVENVCDPLPF